MAPEGLRPHSAIGAASGVTAPLEGRPAKDFSNWSCDTLDSSSVCDRGPRKNPGAFFVPWQQCRHIVSGSCPRRGGSRLRQGAKRRAGSAIGATEVLAAGAASQAGKRLDAPSESERFSPQQRSKGGASGVQGLAPAASELQVRYNALDGTSSLDREVSPWHTMLRSAREIQ